MRVTYQGEPGAYSEEALLKFFREAVPIPCEDFVRTVSRVKEGLAEFCILPVENSLTGSIAKTYDLLLESELPIYGETIHKVSHNLLALSGTRAREIKYVHSHPQALAQCERYLKRKGFLPVPELDTAGSAKKIKGKNENISACIASRRAAEIYGLEVLEGEIEDLPWNYTRFFILSKNPPQKGKKSKTSIVFSVHHRPGELASCLNIFAEREINLTKIESRPDRKSPWHYLFYLDFEGHTEDEKVEKALALLLKRAHFVKILGSYPMGEG